ncbi:hypothetical protein CRUP_034635 [Coryphaenoides rupestris]|nr:hypothetical protein CRUP_034635 [Coryphaenoides rupestris]
MKSNQERNNGCLPPKKREILALEHRPVAAAPQPPVAVPSDALHTENLAWLASVATERCKSRDAENHRGPISSSSLSVMSGHLLHHPFLGGALSAVPLASLPTVYPTTLPQQPGTIQYAQLAPNVQFISSGPYAGYISSHILSANPTSTANSAVAVVQRPHLDGYTTALISPTTKSSTPTRAVLAADTHLRPLPAGWSSTPMARCVKKMEGHGKALLNGEVEVLKQVSALGQTLNHHQQQQHQQQQQPNCGAEAEAGSNKVSLVQTDKICLGKPIARDPLLRLPLLLLRGVEDRWGRIGSSRPPCPRRRCPLASTPPPSHPSSATWPAAGTSMPSATTPPYHSTWSSLADSPYSSRHISTTMPHAYLATALSKCEVLSSLGNHQPPPSPQPLPHPPWLPSLLSLRFQASPPPAPAPPPATPPSCISSAPASSPVVLPPFFMRGSIIQLADGELKRVEDLKTEDFIQSAEISSELKIDSSTVERIDNGQTPNAVLIQFAVGELKAQVCVEVLLEYPFFVFGQGWSSCCPDRTTELFELSCAKLCVGDVCVSLTLRGLRNGSVAGIQQTVGGAKLKANSGATDTTAACQHAVLEVQLAAGCTASAGPVLKTAGGKPQGNGNGMTGSGVERVAIRSEVFPWPGGGGGGAAVYGVATSAVGRSMEEACALVSSGNGEVRHRQTHTDRLPPPPQRALAPAPPADAVAMETQRPPSGRKRRWSAPEREQVDRREEGPQHALPRPSFIPQEVKVSIEGRSSTGS